jgi:putative transposase
MIDFKGHRFEKDIILLCIRWYLAYPLSYRILEEMMTERGLAVDHTNIYHWVQKFTPKLEAVFRKGNKRPVGTSWPMDETYIKIKGQWCTCDGSSFNETADLLSSVVITMQNLSGNYTNQH